MTKSQDAVMFIWLACSDHHSATTNIVKVIVLNRRAINCFL